jgi:hypothetical protein
MALWTDQRMPSGVVEQVRHRPTGFGGATYTARAAMGSIGIAPDITQR